VGMMGLVSNGGTWAGRFLVALVVSAALSTGLRAQTNEPIAATNTLSDTAAAAAAARAAQEAALAQARQEAAAARTALLQYTTQAETRFQELQATLLSQRAAELDSLRAANRFTLLVAAGLSTLGFAGMVLLAIIVWRILGRRAPGTALAYPGAGGFGDGANAALMLVNPVEQANARFLHAIDQLEKRIREMETGSTDTPITVTVTPSPHGPRGNGPGPGPAADPGPALDPATAKQVETLLGKGQSLLSLGQVDQALGCFVEALTLAPDHPEAHLKKAAALEKLDRLDEALREYDAAIARDRSLTMAYLGKGSVFNRLERHGDALQCYEQALRTQHRTQVAE
jgi:tetratricopeptide (TPR) repeat protein